MAVIYMHLDYEGYKSLEEQMRAFKETTHKDTIIEFHGPLVVGTKSQCRRRCDGR